MSDRWIYRNFNTLLLALSAIQVIAAIFVFNSRYSSLSFHFISFLIWDAYSICKCLARCSLMLWIHSSYFNNIIIISKLWKWMKAFFFFFSFRLGMFHCCYWLNGISIKIVMLIEFGWIWLQIFFSFSRRKRINYKWKRFERFYVETKEKNHIRFALCGDKVISLVVWFKTKWFPFFSLQINQEYDVRVCVKFEIASALASVAEMKMKAKTNRKYMDGSNCWIHLDKNSCFNIVFNREFDHYVF